jgi:tagatose-6-phosphate ketose/aldose isomerase
VTHPKEFFRENQPTLIISCARSGNSPESIESVKLADVFWKEYKLF